MSRFKNGTFVLVDSGDDKHTTLRCKQFKYDDNDGKVKDINNITENIRTSDISELKKNWSLMRKLLLRSNDISFAEKISVEIGKIEDVSGLMAANVFSMEQCKRNRDNGLPLRSKEQQNQDVKKFISQKEDFFVSTSTNSVVMANETICTLDQDFFDYQIALSEATFNRKGKIYYSLSDLHNLSSRPYFPNGAYEELLIIYRKIMLSHLPILDVNDIYDLLKCLQIGCCSVITSKDSDRVSTLIKKYAI